MTKEEKFYNALRDIFIGAKIESGSGGIINPTVEILHKIAKASGISIDDLIK